MGWWLINYWTINKICDEIQTVIDKYLLTKASDSETKVFFLKLKATIIDINVNLHRVKTLMISNKAEKLIKKLMKYPTNKYQ